MNFTTIIKIFNSYRDPYPGCILYEGKNKFINIKSILKKNKKNLNLNFDNYEHGYVFKKLKNSILIKFGIDLVMIKYNTCNINIPDKLMPPSFYFQ